MIGKYEKWIIFDVGSWKIKSNTPPKIKKEIQEWLKEKRALEKNGIILD